MATFARRPANPFANVIQRAQSALTTQTRESPPQPAPAPRETAPAAEPENDMRAAAAQRWRNYGGASVIAAAATAATAATAAATDAAVPTPLATAPATVVASSPCATAAPVASGVPAVAARPRPSRPLFGASRRLGSRATPASTAAVPPASGSGARRDT